MNDLCRVTIIKIGDPYSLVRIASRPAGHGFNERANRTIDDQALLGRAFSASADLRPTLE